MLSLSERRVNRTGNAMPHFTIEYSSNLDPDIELRAIVDVVHQCAVDCGLFKIGGIRVRTLRHEIYKIADGNPKNAFMHIRVNILEGRSVPDRERLGNNLLAAVDQVLVKAHKNWGISLSVEVGEIDHNMSFKKNALHAQMNAKGNAA
jgi:5-carboxymethyl-2-hydroxymuconate isomerase